MVTIMMMTLIALTALATDTGMLWVYRRHLQNSVDAAALAGGSGLPDPVIAEAKACEYVYLNEVNGMSGGDCDGKAEVLIEDGTWGAITVENSKITVFTQRTYTPMFGSAIGLDPIDVWADATVAIASIRTTCVFPLYQTLDLLDTEDENDVWDEDTNGVILNKVTLMKTGAEGNNQGNFLALQVDGTSSGAAFRDAIASPDGCDGNQTTETADTATGDKVGPLDQGMAERRDLWEAQGNCLSMDATDYLREDGKLWKYPLGTEGNIELTPETCYRMVKIPLLEGGFGEYNGTEQEVEIIGFLVFYISNWCGQNSDPSLQAQECPAPGTEAPLDQPLENGELWGYYVAYEEVSVDAVPYDELGTKVLILVD